MTRRQLELLTFLKDFIHVKGYCPSYEEMRIAMGAASKSVIFRLINSLEEQGYIARLKDRARAIQIVANPVLNVQLSHIATNDLADEAKRRGLVIGHVVVLGGNKRTFKPL